MLPWHLRSRARPSLSHRTEGDTLTILHSISSVLNRISARRAEPAPDGEHLAAQELLTDYSTVMKSHSSQGISLTGFSI